MLDLAGNSAAENKDKADQLCLIRLIILITIGTRCNTFFLGVSGG